MKTRKILETPALIASGGTTSNAVDMGSSCPIGLIIPTGFEGTKITFTASTALAGTYYAVHQPDATGGVVEITVAAETYVPIIFDELAGMQFFKIVSNTSVSADRTITVLSR